MSCAFVPIDYIDDCVPAAVDDHAARIQALEKVVALLNAVVQQQADVIRALAQRLDTLTGA